MKKCISAVLILAVLLSALAVLGVGTAAEETAEPPIPKTIHIPSDGSAVLNIPQSVSDSDYAVLTGNLKSSAIADHSAWVHSLNLAVSGTTRNESYGFNIMYTNDIDTNVVKLNNAASAATFNGDAIKQTTYVNRPELENLFSESGLDFKLIRMDRMAYLLVKLNGVYEQLGRMCLPENTPTQFFFSNWKTPVALTNIRVETGEKAATDALYGMSFSFTSASVRNYPLSASDWQLEMRVFDTDAENAVEKRLVTVGELSLYSKPGQDDGKWMIQRMKSGDWSRVLIPDEISAALSSGGMYIRFVRKGTNLRAYVSADGENYTFIKERTDVDSTSDVKMQNWQAAKYDKFLLSAEVTAYDDITLSKAGSNAPLMPTYVEDSEYAVFSGNIRALCAADHSAWVHILNLSVSGNSLGFNIMYTNDINTNVVKLKSASTAVTFNGDVMNQVNYVNRPELENLFGENGLDFKLVRMDRMVYLLVNLTGSYEILGRMYLPENMPTQFYFSTWNTPLQITGISVKAGEQAAAAALTDMRVESFGNSSALVRNFITEQTQWSLETRVFDTNAQETSATKKLLTVGGLSLAYEPSADSGKWKIQESPNGSGMTIPDEISEALALDGMYIRFVRNNDTLSALVSANGTDYTLIHQIDGIGNEKETIRLTLSDKCRCEEFSLLLGGREAEKAMIKELKVTTAPDQTDYFENQSFDPSGMVLKAVFYDGGEKTANLSEILFSDAPLPAGTEAVTVYYLGFSADVAVHVVKKALESIFISANPVTVFKENAAFDVTGGVLGLIYNNGDTAELPIEADMCSGYNMSLPGRQTVLVTYTEDEVTKTASYEITVTNRELREIKIMKAPEKTRFTVFGRFSADGLLSLVYDNATSEEREITVGMCSGYNMSMLGKQTVTVSEGGFSTSYEITVELKPVSGISLISEPKKLSYLAGQPLELNGAVIRVDYEDTTSEELDVTDDMIDSFDPYAVGKQTVMLSYAGYGASFGVNIQKSGASPKTGDQTDLSVTAAEVTALLSLAVLVMSVIFRRGIKKAGERS